MRVSINLKLSVLLLLGIVTPSWVWAQNVSNCDEPLSQEVLDINNVRTRIYNNGALFWKGGQNLYEVPKGSGVNALFAGNIWIAGEVGGQLRAAASTYGNYEFWAGPLDVDGSPPADCSVYDNMYNVKKTDVETFETTGSATPDLLGWPTGLGAPTLDANGELISVDSWVNQPLAERTARVIDLAAGERPAITGDQTIWWVMNDRGNSHLFTETTPIGLEVHGEAFSFNLDGPVGDMTFYRYKIYYKGTENLENTYLGLWSDPDLGDASDDYVGSDTTLGLGYVYNGDNDDAANYGVNPPATGYDFFQGPIIPSPGDTALVSGQQVPDFRNLPMTSFVFYNNGGGVQGDPSNGAEVYSYLRGRWLDELPITFGGTGRDFSTIPTNFMYSGDPESGVGWTEANPAADGSLPANAPADRRFVMSTGPFTIVPDDPSTPDILENKQEIVYGIVYARGSSNLNSVTELRKADGLAQSAFDVNFNLPVPPAPPQVTVTELDGRVVLEWENAPTSNNYLESYAEFDPFALDPFAPLEDRSYLFEGYEIIRYSDVADQVGEVVAVYDNANGVQRVIDGPPGEVSEVVFSGRDQGAQTFHIIEQLTNYTTGYYGVRTIAYNELSLPKVFRSVVTRVEVIPSRTEDVLSDAAVEAAASLGEPDIIAERSGAGEGIVVVDVVNPSRITGETYTVEFYEATINADTVLTYDIKRGGTVVFDGSSLGQAAPQRENVIVIDGLQFSITGPEAGIKGIAVTNNAAGPVDPWDMGAYAFNSNGFPMLEVNGITPEGSYASADRPTRGVQQSTSDAVWGVNVGGGDGTFRGGGSSYIERSILGRQSRTIEGSIGANDYEMRFTQRCVDTPEACIGWRRFEDDLPMNVPFEIWNVGLMDGPEDDYRMIPAILDNGGEAWHLSTPGVDTMFTALEVYDVGGDHPVSGGDNDPYTDWVYWFDPVDTSPGEAGYEAFAAAPGNASPALGSEVLARQVLVNWNGWIDADDDDIYEAIDATLPETGTVFKILTFKPNAPGDIFTVNTAGLEASQMSLAEQETALEQISLVPNPYKGASNYERSQLVDEVRFTNLPERATVRVFTLAGSLIRTIEKNSPERFLKWNLTTDNNLPIASGLYLIHVETDAGDRVIKFACVRKRTELNNF